MDLGTVTGMERWVRVGIVLVVVGVLGVVVGWNRAQAADAGNVTRSRVAARIDDADRVAYFAEHPQRDGTPFMVLAIVGGLVAVAGVGLIVAGRRTP